MLLLHGSLLFNLNLVELIYLIADPNIFKALLLQVVHSLLSFRLGLCLRLLHVFLHILASVLIGGLIDEKCTLTSIHLLLQKFVKGDLRKELVVFERFQGFLLNLARVHRATACTSLHSLVRVSYGELAINFISVDSKVALVESKSFVLSIWLEAFTLVPVL